MVSLPQEAQGYSASPQVSAEEGEAACSCLCALFLLGELQGDRVVTPGVRSWAAYRSLPILVHRLASQLLILLLVCSASLSQSTSGWANETGEFLVVLEVGTNSIRTLVSLLVRWED